MAPSTTYVCRLHQWNEAAYIEIVFQALRSVMNYEYLQVWHDWGLTPCTGN